MVTGMQKQVALVREAMADLPEVPVRGVLCFVDADWPLIGAVSTVNNVAVMSPKKLKALLSQPGLLDEGQIADAQWRLHEAFTRQKSAPSPSNQRRAPTRPNKQQVRDLHGEERLPCEVTLPQ